MTYAALPIELNPESLVEQVYEEMETRFPGWEPAEGNPETWLIRAIVFRLIVPLAQLASEMPDEALQRYGEEVIGLPPIEAAPATVASTWQFIDSNGNTIPAGTQVNLPTASGDRIGFRVVSQVVVPAGEFSTGEGEVLLEAIEPGEAGNQLEGPAELVDGLPFVEEITIEGESSGGADAEDPIAYLGRMVETARTLAPRPIIARDVAILARNIPGVARAAVLDNYSPADEDHDPDDPETWDGEKQTTIVPQDVNGDEVSSATKEALEAEFAAKREANFEFFVIDPDYNDVEVQFTVVPRDGYSQEAADEATIAAIEDLLSPAKHGIPGPGRENEWLPVRVLRYQDLVTAVNNVAAVEHYTTLVWRLGSEGEHVETDLTMSGAAPLPVPTSVEVE